MSSIAIVGKSGTGKSTSIGNIPQLGIKGLNHKETAIINVAGKDLPFKGGRKKYSGKLQEGGNFLETADPETISKAIKYISDERADIKNIVIDDGQFIMSFEFMSKARQNGYSKFAEIGVNMSKVVNAARKTRSDLKVYFLWHPENDKEDSYKMKTVGNMLDNYLTLEGLFTVILYSRVSKDPNSKPKYEFVTNHDGEFPAKSPVGMFEELYIPNDLGLVSEKIDEYNEG